MSLSRKSLRFCRFNVFLSFVKIAFTWLTSASAMYEVGNASKKGLAAAVSLGYIVTVLILLIFGKVFTFEQHFHFKVHMHLLSSSSKSDS